MRNAYSGYTYQQQITLLFLSIMDVERNISEIEIEAKTRNDFDDLIVSMNTEVYQIQIKDFEKISLDDLSVKEDKIYLKSSPHKLSTKKNILFFKYITITPNEKILDFPSYKLRDDIYIVSMTRTETDERINYLYRNNSIRKNEIESFFHSILDKRIWQIPIESLPELKTFITELQEKSVTITHKLLEFEKLLLIEGKPGVGKSHFVNTLTQSYTNPVVYRFWIGNQDKDYQDRLKFTKFIYDLNIKLFSDQKERTQTELLKKLTQDRKTLIIDGLDHIENYNRQELDDYIDFINRASDYCKVIVLSRPLVSEINWKKHTLNNWNVRQTEKVLIESFYLKDYSVIDDIHKISQGYPLVVKFLAEHYKLHKVVPSIEQVEDIDSYYQSIIANEKGKQSLSIFLCVNSYLMVSEIELFIGNEKEYVEEFIKEHPYLFDIKLNRISLFHDSFNTFLRKRIKYNEKKEKTNSIVTKSILNFEKRFLSRFGYFQLSREQQKEILIRFTSIKMFKNILENSIDFESINAFYLQLRETLKEINPDELNVINYYDFSLIVNLIVREHLSTINTFYYTYVRSLIANGVTDDDITSSEYLFGMYYYVKIKNASLLCNTTSNSHYDTTNFYENLENDVYEEESFISKHEAKFSKKNIDKALKGHLHPRDAITSIIENFFIHAEAVEDYEVLKSSFDDYINGNHYRAFQSLSVFISDYKMEDYYARWILQDALNNLISYGYTIGEEENEYQTLSLKEFILKHKHLGSFKLLSKIHNFIRLALLEDRKIDIGSIHLFWTKFYQRKDYTLYGLPVALKVLHSKSLISLKDCVQLIREVQESSEKGYRHLLADFIKLFPPFKIIPFLERTFDIQELRVEWFKLPTKYINKISEQTYHLEENELIRYHRSSLSIPLQEVENVLHSNKFKKLETTLEFFKAEISFKESEKSTIKNFRKFKLRFAESTEERKYKTHKQTSKENFERGILSYRDINFIKKKGLKPAEVAAYSDGYHTSLSDIDVFKIYDAKQIDYVFKTILYNSLINKTKSINYFYSLFYHPGNVLSLIGKYRNDEEFKEATISFKEFMTLSMFELNLK